MHFERRRDGAIDVVPGDIYNSSGWIGEGSESIWEKIEVVCSASWTFINDLRLLATYYLGENLHTIAVMLFPLGPVTDTHAPQLAEVSQFESDRAVPKIPEGRV